MGVADLLVSVMEDSGYVRELQAEETHDARARLENLQELVGVAREYEGDDPEAVARGLPRQRRADQRSRLARSGLVVRDADDDARRKGPRVLAASS